MYTYNRSRIYPVPFGRNVWRMRKVYTTTRVKYKMYKVHTLERLPNTRSPCSRAHGSNTVCNTPIYKYIFLYVFFSLFFLFLFVRIPGWNLLHTSPYLNSTLLFCVCVNMHTYMYHEFSYYYNKNTIAVYSWIKIYKTLFLRSLTTMHQLHKIQENILPLFSSFVSAVTHSFPRNNINGQHYWLICTYVSLHSNRSLCTCIEVQ